MDVHVRHCECTYLCCNETVEADKGFNATVLAYRQAMEAGATGETAPGYIKTGEGIGLTKAQSTEVFGYLKTSGIVEVVGIQTKIKKWVEMKKNCEKIIKSYNLDSDIDQWLKTEAKKTGRSTSDFLNLFIRKEMMV